MLPQIRNQEHLFPVPKFTVSSDDVKNFTNELKGFHEVFSDCFQLCRCSHSIVCQRQLSHCLF